MKGSRLILAAALAAFVCVSAGAQEKGAKVKGAKENKPGRVELAAKQASHICIELAFDEATTARFKEVYAAQQKEMWELRNSCQKQGKSGSAQEGSCKHRSEMSEDEVRQDLEASFGRSQKMLDLRKKYYKEYSKFLTQKQIARVYDIEKQMMNGHNKGKGHKEGPEVERQGERKDDRPAGRPAERSGERATKRP